MRGSVVVVVVLCAVSALPACAKGCGGDEGPVGASSVTSASATASAPPPPTDQEIAAATDVVVSYYAAIAAKDCVTLPKLVDPPLTADECKQAMQDAQEHGSDFDRIVKSVPDGRDPTVVLVTVRLASGKGPREQLVRVKRFGDAWKIQP